MAHQAYMCFLFLYHEATRSISTPPGCNASRRVMNRIKFAGTHLYTWVEELVPVQLNFPLFWKSQHTLLWTMWLDNAKGLLHSWPCIQCISYSGHFKHTELPQHQATNIINQSFWVCTKMLHDIYIYCIQNVDKSLKFYSGPKDWLNLGVDISIL